MKKTFLFVLGAMLSINAWSYDNVAATIKWADGTDKAVVTSDALDGIKETKRKVGTALTEGSRSNLAANNGVAMATFTPATNKPGKVTSAMVEYSVKMKKGVTFTLTGVSFDAIKQGTDGASFDWTYAVDGIAGDTINVPEGELLRDNNTSGTPALNHSQTITASAGQEVSVRFYVSGFNAGKLLCLSNVQLTGIINGEEEVRVFTDFKIDFRSETPTFVLPEGGVQPSNVSFANLNYKDAQHGIQGGTITVNVDGPVKFTLGGCSWGNGIAISKNDEALTTIDNKVGCDNSGVGSGYTKFVTWTYNVEEAAVLTFTVNGYLPYFFAEACDFVPQVEVRYYDTDGKTLIGSEIVNGGSKLAYKYNAESVTVAAGKAFRGWFDGTTLTSLKVAEGIELYDDLNLFAKATDIEVAQLGAIFNYDLTQKSFYIEDHELLSTEGGVFHDSKHGWVFSNGNTLSVQVAGNVLLIVGVCEESATGTTEVKDADGNVVGSLQVEKKVTGDGSKQSISYKGEATTLTFHFTATNYIHNLKVYNISELPEKGETGYYEIAPNDGAGFILALESAKEGDKIFLPNGVYDLGESVLTAISQNNISIIGQSMEGTIIKNAPDFHNEGIGKTATLLITKNVSGTYLQDLTLQNAMDYYKNNVLYCEKRNANGSGSDVITASNAIDSDHGYVFEGCTIKSVCPIVSLGRAWNNQPEVEYLNTTIDYSAGQFALADSKGEIKRWTTPLMSAGAWPTFGEYNTCDTAGNLLTPASNVVTFIDKKSNDATKDVETVLSAEQAAVFTMANTLGDWAATAKTDATQAVCDLENIEDEGIYLVETLNGNAELMLGSQLKEEVFPEDSGITVRKANARGGFGWKAGEEPQGVENTKAAEAKKAVKVFRDGQVVILRDGREFNVLGAELK